MRTQSRILLVGLLAAVGFGVSTAAATDVPEGASLVEARGSAPIVDGRVDLTPVDAAGFGGGLWLADQAGRIEALGGVESFGDLTGVPLQRPVVGIAASRAGDGYWMVAGDGGVFAFGGARFHGSMGGIALQAPVVGIAATPSGDGYWLVAADGGVFAFGDAPFHGSMGGVTLNRPVVGIAPTPTGEGYWLVGSDGGVFAFGDAPFLGAAVNGSVDIVDLAPSPGGDGYWVALADGTVRSAGSAPVLGGPLPGGDTTAIVAPATGGYWLIGTGNRLPEGGASVFDDRMLVAHYGSPLSPLLGILGETGPEAAIDRVVARAADYEALGVPAVPTMEIITTIATSFPGGDGDFSAPTDTAVLRPWIDLAATNDVYVLLDLQPGRSDFLSQARLYEELLGEPHVGLAIDPEWRMGPTQRPGRVIGSVGAAEVNALSAWLDELTASNGLPEKLFVIHQFTAAMVQDRAAIVDRPNLATTFHIDGFGSQAQKLAKFDQLHPDEPFDYGIKLFIDEDTRMFTPPEVLALDPRPDLVTHQ